MEYNIKESGRNFDVQISAFTGQVDDLLKAFGSCQEGTCNCPTDEYENLESLDVEQDGSTIILHLRAKEQASLNRSNIETCLNSTISDVNLKSMG